ncbi:ABC transporter substrate-binding protein [Dehalococcoidia bacterium]|nr:ABC transporter substrate-binding protein [Dehalococcoidia bacterium]
MNARYWLNTFWIIGLLTMIVVFGIGCSSPATPTPTPEKTDPETIATVFSNVPGILDPQNSGWPRSVKGSNGSVTIPNKPQRIITASIGHDEMTLALVPASRLVGVGSVTQDSTYSNVANLTKNIPVINTDPEILIAQQPDVMVVSPYMPQETIEALNKLNVPIIQTGLSNNPTTRIQDILLLGYIYGEEERAMKFAKEVEARHKSLTNITHQKDFKDKRKRTMAVTRYSDQIWTAGIDSTEGNIIEMAGGINVAANAGIVGNATTSLEGIIAMDPEVIFIPQPIDWGANELKTDLLKNPALKTVAAIKSNQVYIVDSRIFTTLSFWNIKGAESLARILWPSEFSSEVLPPFTLPPN